MAGIKNYMHTIGTFEAKKRTNSTEGRTFIETNVSTAIVFRTLAYFAFCPYQSHMRQREYTSKINIYVRLRGRLPAQNTYSKPVSDIVLPATGGRFTMFHVACRPLVVGVMLYDSAYVAI